MVALVQAVWGDLLEGASELPDRIADAKKAGLILEPIAMGQEMRAESSQNAYRDLAPVYQTVHDDSRFLSKDTATAMTAWAAHPGLLDRALEALEKPRYDPARDYRQGIAVTFAEYGSAKDLAKALAHQVRDAAHKGDLPRAQRCLEGGIQLALHLSQEPLLISNLVALAVRAIVETACWDAIEGHPGQEGWARLADQLQSTSLNPDLARVVRGELLLNYQTMKTLDPWGRDFIALFHAGLDDDKSRLPPVGPGSRDAAIARVLAHYTKLYGDLKACQSWDESVSVCRAAMAEVASDHRPSSKMLSYMTFATPEIIELFRTRKEVDRIVQTGSQLLAWNKAHGRFPDSVPAQNDRRIIYKRFDDGFRLYAVGPNGHDDGGPSEPGLRRATASDDYGISYKRGH